MSTVGKVAAAMIESVGKTKAELMLAMAEAAYSVEHSEFLFAEWMVLNSGRIREACIELGVEPPPEGPNLFRRLKEAVTPELRPE
uniref:Uncharacterized protein n=1 Tax=viral metagenome TaxID=1070528 RepID=A0A6M3X802_9ZZZZ